VQTFHANILGSVRKPGGEIYLPQEEELEKLGKELLDTLKNSGPTAIRDASDIDSVKEMKEAKIENYFQNVYTPKLQKLLESINHPEHKHLTVFTLNFRNRLCASESLRTNSQLLENFGYADLTNKNMPFTLTQGSSSTLSLQATNPFAGQLGLLQMKLQSLGTDLSDGFKPLAESIAQTLHRVKEAASVTIKTMQQYHTENDPGTPFAQSDVFKKAVRSGVKELIAQETQSLQKTLRGQLNDITPFTGLRENQVQKHFEELFGNDALQKIITEWTEHYVNNACEIDPSALYTSRAEEFRDHTLGKGGKEEWPS